MVRRAPLTIPALALSVGACNIDTQAAQTPATETPAQTASVEAPVAEHPLQTDNRTAEEAEVDVELLELRRIPDVAEQVVKSVVNISTTRSMPEVRMPPGFEGFGLPFRMPPGQPGPGGSLGSGVLVGDGLVVTNHHVVDNADSIAVGFSDGRELGATLVGSDAQSDVAVLKLDEVPDGLVPLEWGDSENIRLGETVLAIGNPFGMGHSVTRGIVSAKGRAQVGIVDYEDFIQTDAAINPGNSGGALVTLDGRLIGINTAILSRSGGNQGIGLAIPAHLAKRVVADLSADGVIDRGWLGVSIQSLDEGLAEALGLEDTRGVLIGDVTDGSPAQRAGFEAGDVVTRWDGEAVDGPSAFRNGVALAGDGHRFEAEVVRNGKRKAVRGTLGRHPDAPERASLSGDSQAEDASPARSLGIALRADEAGLRIAEVAPRSPAARAGLKPGELLLEVDRKPATVERLQESLEDGQVLLRVQRGEHIRYVAVRAD
jgi:Do/DeqQ family serine protease